MTDVKENDIVYCVVYGTEVREARVALVPKTKEERILVYWTETPGGGFVDYEQCFATHKEAEENIEKE